jgi:hypothetical protein
MIQEEQVKYWCAHHHGITSSEAFYNLGIAHLPKVILNLAEKGHDVKKIVEHGTNHHTGAATHWTRYFVSQTPSLGDLL